MFHLHNEKAKTLLIIDDGAICLLSVIIDHDKMTIFKYYLLFKSHFFKSHIFKNRIFQNQIFKNQIFKNYFTSSDPHRDIILKHIRHKSFGL